VLHVPVMMAVTYYVVIPVVGDKPAIVGALMILGLTLPIVLVLATLSFTFIERPAIAWARRRRRREHEDKPSVIAAPRSATEGSQ
jgi:peptidoglycan/LPS O-acetylase OafA/YrhL